MICRGLASRCSSTTTTTAYVALVNSLGELHLRRFPIGVVLENRFIDTAIVPCAGRLGYLLVVVWGVVVSRVHVVADVGTIFLNNKWLGSGISTGACIMWLIRGFWVLYFIIIEIFIVVHARSASIFLHLGKLLPHQLMIFLLQPHELNITITVDAVIGPVKISRSILLRLKQSLVSTHSASAWYLSGIPTSVRMMRHIVVMLGRLIPAVKIVFLGTAVVGSMGFEVLVIAEFFKCWGRGGVLNVLTAYSGTS